jgi:hypothetical protein
MSEINISSRTGLQRIVVIKTGAGVSITAYGSKGGRNSVHIFEECIPEMIEAFRRLGLVGEETQNAPTGAEG